MKRLVNTLGLWELLLNDPVIDNQKFRTGIHLHHLPTVHIVINIRCILILFFYDIFNKSKCNYHSSKMISSGALYVPLTFEGRSYMLNAEIETLTSRKIAGLEQST